MHEGDKRLSVENIKLKEVNEKRSRSEQTEIEKRIIKNF